jgi:acetyl-CoA synthetase
VSAAVPDVHERETGRPKGCQHSTGGYLAYVAGTSKYIQDIHPEDVYWCMADIGWITGHSYIVYGPLAIAATSVIYEGVPTYPDAGRPWRIAERLNVNIFHTSPTAIRMLRKTGEGEPSNTTTTLKHMTTVGEPIEPSVALVHDVVGKEEAVIVDTGKENGGFPQYHAGAELMKPGSAGPAAGDLSRIWDETGVRSLGVGRPEHLHPEPLARNLPNHLGRSRAVHRYLLPQILQGPEQQGLA